MTSEIVLGYVLMLLGAIFGLAAIVFILALIFAGQPIHRRGRK